MTENHIKPVERYVVSGAEARQPANIVMMFEALKGRAATAEEIASVERVLTEAAAEKS